MILQDFLFKHLSFMKNTIAEVSKETLVLEAFLKNFHPGDKITYETIEAETKIIMSNRGKGFMRTALNRLNMEYSCIRGVGIELGSPQNATGLIANRVVKIDKSIKRAGKTTKRVTDQFYDKLSMEDKQHVNVWSSIFSFINGYSRNARLLFQKPVRKAIN